MRVKSEVGLAVGPTNPAHWGQVLVQPNGYGILEINDTGGSAQQKGVRILSLLGEKLAADPASLKQIEKIADEISDRAITSLILLVPVGKVVYLVMRGEGLVYIKRGSELAKLMHQDGAISGEIRQGDTLLLASTGFARALPSSEILGLFDHLSAQEVAEKLTLILHEREGGEGSVALVYTAVAFEQDAAPTSVLSEKDAEEEGRASAQEPPRTWRPNRPGKLSLFFGRIVLGVRSFFDDLRHIRERPQAIPKVAAVIISLLFLLSVVLGVTKQLNTQTSQDVQTALTDARHAFEEGVALLTLNPVKGRERLTAAKTILDPMIEKVNARTKEGREVTTLYAQITDNLTQAMQVVEASPTLFFDMSLVKQGAAASAFSLEGKTLVVADQAGKTIYTLDVTTKNATILGGGDIVSGVRDVTSHGEKAYALTPEGVVELRMRDKKSTLVIKRDESWGDTPSFVSFGGNIYILDTQKNRIWKYVAVESGFSPIREYLNPDTFPDFATANSMTIDGTVWVATRVGRILRFIQGKEETFSSKGIEPALEADLLVYATDATNNIYILDRTLSRVVVVDKDGTYLAQYRWPDEFKVTRFVVSEEQKKIFLLSSGKIYALELK